MSEAQSPQETSSISYLGLVRENPDFRYLWFGQIISLLGDWFNLIASASLVSQLTGSGLAVGALFAIRLLAPFLISPIAGIVADRYNRKAVLILMDVARAVVVVGFLLIRRPEQVWLLYLLTGLQLAMGGIFFPTRNAILPDLVEGAELGAANALSSATWSVMLAFGAAAGGLVSGGWGIYPAFTIDAATFVVSALVLSRIGSGAQSPSNRGEVGRVEPARFFTAYVEGLSYVGRRVDVLILALHKAAKGVTVFGIFQVIQVAVAERIFVMGQGGGIGLGLMFAMVGLGTGLGPIVVRRFTHDRVGPLRIAIALSYLITTIGLIITAPLLNFPVFLFGTLLRAFGDGMTWVFSNQLLYQYTDREVRGRVFATDFALFTLASSGSSAVGGWVLDQNALSISGLLWLMAGLTLIPGLLWTIWLWKRGAAGRFTDVR